ncbi:hypothetical protein NLJ89_g592 [Agrocybe chaxingu]|uniref:Nephrocystin 3-like N-terminal domain-containing protein n=1 Tax=Agrocybe chaxingu TaxID=84603 RepID=A0A9W8TEP1_9AGAR|nr:hypothetical protein NLJ89_g592 [Agrocybe chaxingu]
MPGDNLLITGGTFIQHYDSHFTESGIWPSGLSRLHESVSPTAFHNSTARFDAPKCHPNTRVAILRKIIDWVLGAGKSAIAQTLAALLTTFFSRTDSTRNHSKTPISTLGYQIALVVPPFRGALEQVIDFDPCIFERSLETQLMRTIICPLESLSKSAQPLIPNLIIIDGIDECRDHSTQRQILQAISGVQRRSHLRLKFLVTSRAESQIMAAFNFISLQTALNHLVLDDSYAPDQDIGLFLQDRFRDIRRTHRFRSLIPDGWPGKTIIAYLVRKSSGQFIHASIVVRFIDSPRHHPVERLEIVRGLRPPSHDLPFAELDELYRHILSSVADISQVLRALGILFILPKTSYYSNINARIVEKVLSLEEGNIDVLFADLLPTLRVDNSGNIRFFHASLPDFLCDATRSQCYFVDLAVAYADMAAWIARTPDRRMRLILGHASDLIICCRDAVLTTNLKTSLLKMKFWKDDEQWLREIKVHEGHWHPAPYAFIRTLADKRSVDPGWDEIYRCTLATLDKWLVYKLDEIDHPLLPCLYTLKRRNPKFPAHSIMTRLLMSESDARGAIIKHPKDYLGYHDGFGVAVHYESSSSPASLNMQQGSAAEDRHASFRSAGICIDTSVLDRVQPPCSSMRTKTGAGVVVFDSRAIDDRSPCL